MKRFRVDEVFKDVLKCSAKVISYSNVTVDSRSVINGSIFFAFKGEKTDGHLYLEQAFSKGAVCCVITDDKYFDDSKPMVLVKDVLGALKDLGKWNLEQFKGKRIVITGSVGKTSTKSIVSLVLSQKYKVYEAFKNFNNELGIAIVSSNINLDAEVAVFEIGTNNPGEIEALAKFLMPNIAIVTNVGHSHIGRFGNLVNLTREKLSISSGLVDGGEIWINDTIDTSCYSFPKNIKLRKFGRTDDSDISLEEITVGKDTSFIIRYGNFRYGFKINHPYSHFAMNALPAIGIALESGFHYEEIYRALEKFSPVEGRGEIIEKGGKLIIDDTYNAGFEAILSAIENLSKISLSDKYAILGELAEIEGFEEKLYSKLKELVEKSKDIRFYLVGENFKGFDELNNVSLFKDKRELMESDLLSKNGVYLVKASRSKKFEEIVEYLKKGESNAI